jgi:hypothetical protein
MKIRIVLFLTFNPKKNRRPIIFLFIPSWSCSQANSSPDSSKLSLFSEVMLTGKYLAEKNGNKPHGHKNEDDDKENIYRGKRKFCSTMYYFMISAFLTKEKDGKNSMLYEGASSTFFFEIFTRFLSREHRGQGWPKSLYISPAVSHFYGTEYEIWAGFGPFGSTENFGLGCEGEVHTA